MSGRWLAMLPITKKTAGTFVKRNHDLLVCCTELIDVVGERNGVVVFVGEKIAPRVVFEGTPAALGFVREMPDVAVAFQDQIRARRQIGEFLPGRIVGPRSVPGRPDGSICRA